MACGSKFLWIPGWFPLQEKKVLPIGLLSFETLQKQTQSRNSHPQTHLRMLPLFRLYLQNRYLLSLLHFLKFRKFLQLIASTHRPHGNVGKPRRLRILSRLR